MPAAAPARAPSRAPAPSRARRRRAAAARASASRAPAHAFPAAVGHAAGAVGHAAEAVRYLPDSGFVQQLTRGRAWIAVLGVLLAGIVALNVVSLSLTASTGQMEQQATVLEQRNSALEAGIASQLSNDRVEAAALGLGLTRPETDAYNYRSTDEASAGQAADRIAAAYGGS